MYVLVLVVKKNKAITCKNSSTNVLAFADGVTLSSGASYDMTAELGEKAELEIVLTNLSTTTALWFYTNKNDWNVSTYNSGSRNFQLIKKIKYCLHGVSARSWTSRWSWFLSYRLL